MLAIVIPYYKFSFFEETLESLSNQTDKRFKVYIGDDASPENPSGLLEKYREKFDFVYHRFQENLGGSSLTKQWERCIALSGDEEWIMILGDDDILGENVVESFYNNYNTLKEKSNVVRYATVVLDEQNNFKSDKFIHPQFENGFDFFKRKFIAGTRSSLSEYFFKREAYLKYGFVAYPSSFYSDDRAWIDFSNGKQIYSINETVIYIRVSNLSFSGNVTSKVLNSASFKFLNDIYKNRLHVFSKKERIILLKRIEHSLDLSEERNFFLWFDLYFRCVINFDKKEIFKFHKRIVKRILKRNILAF